MMKMTYAVSIVLLASPSIASAACEEWVVAGQWSMIQANKIPVALVIAQDHRTLTGSAKYADITGTVAGHLEGDHFKIRISWARGIPNCRMDGLFYETCEDGDQHGIYEGSISNYGEIEGTTWPFESPNAPRVNWFSKGLEAQCVLRPEPVETVAPTVPRNVTVRIDGNLRKEENDLFPIVFVYLDWSPSFRAKSYQVLTARGINYSAPSPKEFKVQRTTDLPRTQGPIVASKSDLQGTRNLFYKVCALNEVGSTCTSAVPAIPLSHAHMQAIATSPVAVTPLVSETLTSPVDAMSLERPAIAAGASTINESMVVSDSSTSNETATTISQDTIRPSDAAAIILPHGDSVIPPDPIKPLPGSAVAIPPDPIKPTVSRRLPAGIMESLERCQTGFVWREARPTDHVCVTPESRASAAQENAVAASRRDPAGAYGPNTCVLGFVWREAYAADVVCVTPERRTAIKAENNATANRIR